MVGHLETNEFPRSAVLPRAHLGADDVLTGVGMWNMKGPVAAYLAAVAAVRAAGIELAGDVLVAGVAGTYDQTIAVETRLTGSAAFEGYSIGTRHLLAGGVRADFGIVGEPTSFRLVRRHFGLVRLRIGIEQPVRAAGSSVADDLTPGKWAGGDDDTPDVLSLLADLVPALREWGRGYRRTHLLDDRAPHFGVQAIEGGSPWSGSANSGAVFLSVNTRPGDGAEQIAAEVAKVVAAVTARAPRDLESRIEPYLDLTPPEIAEGSPLVEAILASHGDVFGGVPERTPVHWHSDATPLADVGIPALNYGCPGRYEFHDDGRVADEYVRADDLVQLARVYAALIVRICGRR